MKIGTIAIAAGLAVMLGAASLQTRSDGQKAVAHAKITVAQANAIALRKYPGKVVGKTPLENEEGKLQYGVMVRSGKTLREVMVNAATGRIDSVEVTTAAKERAEKRSDESKARKLRSRKGESETEERAGSPRGKKHKD